MRKGQLFIVTIVFLVGLVSTVHQALFSYSSIDLSEPFLGNDFYIINNIKKSTVDIIRTSNNCHFYESNSLKYNMQEFESFVEYQKPKEGFTTNLFFNITCDNWDIPESGVVVFEDHDVVGRNIEISGNMTFPRIVSEYIITCPDGTCVFGEACVFDCFAENYCSDGVDNDENGYTDCDDFSCAGDPACQGTFTINNNTGQPIASFDGNGGLTLAGTCFVLSQCIPPANSFVIKNNAGDPVAYINNSGSLCIESGNCNDNSPNCSPANPAFKLKDNNGVAVITIDDTGDLCLTGALTENA